MQTRIRCLAFTIIFVFSLSVWVSPAGAKKAEAPKIWGLSMGIRYAAIPFKTEVDTTYDIVPLIFYDHGRVFIDGLTGGFRFYDSEKWQFSAIGRYRFFDIPREYQNQIREDGLDVGGQLKYRITDNWDVDFEVLTEERGYVHANAITKYRYASDLWEVEPFFRLRWKSDDFNNNFYGLGVYTPNNAFDYQVGSDFRYHIISNLYIIGQATLTILDETTRNLEIIDKGTQGAVFAGIGFFNEKKPNSQKSYLKSKYYLRLAHGWATPSSVGDIFSGQTRTDEFDNQLTSLFLGVPLSDTLFTLPINVYLTPGAVYHHSSEVQNSIWEYVLAVKFYYTVKWPTPWRIGFAEGVSYMNEVSYIERQYMERQGYRPSELLNYLDFSFDISLGHLFNLKPIEDLWLGWSVHHRSGIFSTSSAFGRISGGSNYNSVYLQYHF